MVTYVMLVNYTEQGLKTFRDSPDRSRRTAEMLEQMGGRFTNIFLTLGPHDFVVTVELPDDESMAKFRLLVGSEGNLRLTVLKAFSRESWQEITSALS